MIVVDGDSAIAGLESLRAAIEAASRAALAAGVREATKSAQGTELFRDGSGETRHSIHGDTAGHTGWVSAGGAAMFLENGTRAHMIEARRARVLAFVRNGATIFRPRVQHPGTQPRPFMERAAEAGVIAASYAAEEFVRAAIGV